MAEGMDLGKQYGPLPLGGWLVVIAGGLGLAYFINRNQGQPQPQLLAEPDVGTGLVPAGAAFPPPSQPDDTEPDNNQAWSIRALNYLIGRGFDPGQADNAVRKYVSGENLTVQEQGMINSALLGVGVPPEPIQPVEVPSTPGGGVPFIRWGADLTQVKAGTSFKLSGQLGYGSSGPGSPQRVKIVFYHSIYPFNMPWFTYYTMTDAQGNFSTTSHNTAVRGKVQAVAEWEGLQARDQISII